MSAATASLQPVHSSAAEQRLAEQKAGEQRAHEPSMEEILASIRRIIADDSAIPLIRKPAPALFREVAPVAPVAEPVPEAHAPVAALAAVEPIPLPREPDLAAEPQPAPVPVEVLPEPVLAEEEDVLDLAYPHGATVHFEQPAAEPDIPAWQPAPVAAIPHPVFQVPPPAPFAEALLSPGADAAVATSFQTLAASMFLANKDMVEAMTREMLRPMLKTWLDDNLPVLVERLVRIEIERVARGGR